MDATKCEQAPESMQHKHEADGNDPQRESDYRQHVAACTTEIGTKLPIDYGKYTFHIKQDKDVTIDEQSKRLETTTHKAVNGV